mgnify:CR=1 FL=1
MTRQHRFHLSAIFAATLVAVAAIATPVLAQESYDTLRKGPRVGAVMARALDGVIDQNGDRQSLQTLRGKSGLILLFHRSFEW